MAHRTHQDKNNHGGQVTLLQHSNKKNSQPYHHPKTRQNALDGFGNQKQYTTSEDPSLIGAGADCTSKNNRSGVTQKKQQQIAQYSKNTLMYSQQ